MTRRLWTRDPVTRLWTGPDGRSQRFPPPRSVPGRVWRWLRLRCAVCGRRGHIRCLILRVTGPAVHTDRD